MPNWVSTRLTVTGEVEALNRFKEKAASYEKAPFSFQPFIPRPESLDITEGSEGETGYGVFIKKKPLSYQDEKRQFAVGLVPEELLEASEFLLDIISPSSRELAKQYYDNEQQYGHRSWYSWSCDNWGTKWDAARPRVDEFLDGDAPYLTYCFDTAWSPCEPVISAMSEQFPELTFTVVFDEESHAFYYESVYSAGEEISREELDREDDDEDEYCEEDGSEEDCVEALFNEDKGNHGS